jgi:hypothetical protein
LNAVTAKEEKMLALSPIALKNTKLQFSSQNHQLFEFFGLAPKSLTHKV